MSISTSGTLCTLCTLCACTGYCFHGHIQFPKTSTRILQPNLLVQPASRESPKYLLDLTFTTNTTFSSVPACQDLGSKETSLLSPLPDLNPGGCQCRLPDQSRMPVGSTHESAQP
jgi:hypothetical protein